MDAAFEVDGAGAHGDPSLRVVKKADRGLNAKDM